MTANDLYDKKEQEAAYQMANIAGIGNKSIFKMLEYAGSVQEAFLLSEKEIGDILEPRQAQAFLRGRERRIKKTTAQLKKETGMDFIPFTSEQYPERLRNIPDPPFCLYVKGKVPEEAVPTVAIVGARACSEYGKAVAAYFGRRLGSGGVQVISGMARGIDGIAQRGALEGGGETYAVLGCGADICYPLENMDLYKKIPQSGGVISEYPPGTEAQSKLFPPRNRIISGLADVLLVVEARKRSGTYITVLQALEQGKEVYAVPGRITDALSDGCNYLLTQGAGMATSPEVILEELSQKGQMNLLQECTGKNTKKISAVASVKNIGNESGRKYIMETDKAANRNEMTEQVILTALDITPISTDELYEKINKKCRLSMPEFLLMLTKMQIRGIIIGEGNYFRRTCNL